MKSNCPINLRVGQDSRVSGNRAYTMSSEYNPPITEYTPGEDIEVLNHRLHAIKYTQGNRGVRKHLGLAKVNTLGYDATYNSLGLRPEIMTGPIYSDSLGWLQISTGAYTDDVLAVLHSLMVGYEHPTSETQTEQVRLAAEKVKEAIIIMDKRHFMDGGHGYKNSPKERAVVFE